MKLKPISKRDTALMWLTDEDFDLIGIDGKTVSNADFQEIVNEMQEYFDESYSIALKQAFDIVMKRNET